MTRLEDCCYRCATDDCDQVCCGDLGDDWGHADDPVCASCCEQLHLDERIREALRDWGRSA